MQTLTTIPVTDLEVGDVVVNFGNLPVSEIMIDGPSAYGVRVHGPSSYVIMVDTDNGLDTYTLPSWRHVTIVS